MIIYQNTLNNPKEIVKSTKNFMKDFTSRRQFSKLLILNFLTKFLTDGKYKTNNFSLISKALNKCLKRYIKLHKLYPTT